MSRFPAYRPRRLRRTDALRRLVRETRVVPEQLVQPLFVVPGRGVVRPVDSMPGLLQPIASVLPLTFLVDAVREVIVNGVSIFAQLPTLAGLAVWLVLALTLAIRGFRWKEVAR